jgi:mycofactocin glycosyltransferase
VIPLPEGFGLELDPSVHTYRDDRVLVGGTPLRIIRLSEAGSAALRECGDGRPGTDAARRLGRRLVEAGMAQPIPPLLAPPGTVTVVVPVRDRPAQLDLCLSALERDDRVIVVDDGSVDPTAVAGVCDRHGAELVRCDRAGGPAAARNLALARVNTDYVAFLDSDCVPTPGWMARLARHLTDPSVGAVAPRIRATPAARPASSCSRFAVCRSPLDMGARGGDVGPSKPVRYVPTAALLARTRALAGGFDEALRYGEDVDLVWRIADAGWRVRYAPEVRVHHQEPDRWRGLLRRRFDYGTSAAPLSRRHPGRLAPVLLSPWPALSAALVLARRPLWGAGALAPIGWRLAARMHAAGAPVALAPLFSLRAAAGTMLALGRATTMLAPLALGVAVGRPRSRLGALTLLLAPPLADWWRRRPRLDPLRFAVAAIADDAAYGLGVWTGCARARTLAPLLPSIRTTTRG